MVNKKTMALMALALIMLSGCSRGFRASEVKDDDLVEVSYEAVDQLLLDLREPLPRGSLVVINSLVNVGELEQTLAFGRIVSDQISSAFHRSGYRVMGMELPTEIFAKNEAGILQLPDKTKEALNNVGAKAVVVGSFAPGYNNVYVSLRVVDIASQNVISSTDYSVSMGPDAKVLVKKPPVPAPAKP
ncbi:FlgO family outer membrane protein [Methylomonas sp. OY6]|uniref:FlgO family outer membrane protein n=1 Tax=Methylomonas defluvii TaxID=3045149 RepID=A0ABU4UEQ6_9GAMM|nr:FlgO family outer membrane protein [Methylomonas sp. OY6]MDX8127824.1 FlgO family outer membrane protein [Methylomonas sp. OY6]